ncbi:hypothetical protein ACP70R_010779 [Stipagrostis hirtigluma subsp. patula]
MKHAARLPSRGGASSATAAHRLSHAVAKSPPRKIRIVHVLAPEVIKTDARHFRELVQRLTGKPDTNGAGAGAAASPPEDGMSPPPPDSSCDTTSDEGAGAAAVIKMEVKEEAETSSGGGGFLRALEMEDGGNEMFFQGLEDFLFSSCNTDGFGV